MLWLVAMVTVEDAFAPVLVRLPGENEGVAPVGSPEADKLTVQELLFPLKPTVAW